MTETKRPHKPKEPNDPDSPPVRVMVEQQVDAVSGGEVTGLSIGQMTVQRDAIIQNIQYIHQRALTAEEAAQRGADLELELLARGVSDLAQRLATQASAAPSEGSSYKGLLAYGLGDADRFYGRHVATGAVLDSLRRGRLTVLHAESGAGKSSLLQAGVAARLIGAGDLAVCLRPYRSDPAAAIKEAFLDLDRAPRLAGLPLREFLRYVTEILGPDRTLYLVLDQFEEFFAYLEAPARAAFSTELGECLHDESLNVRWLVAVRGEALSRLAEMEDAGVEPFENEYRLARLTREEAREAMTGPGFVFEAGLVEAVLDGLVKNGEVAPPQLQLVCLALTEGLAPPAAIGRERYDRLDGAEGILRNYLVRQVQGFPPEEREPVRCVLRALVTTEARRAVLTYPDLVKEWEVQGGDRSVLDRVLARLVERRLLVVQERSVDGEHTYELAHDYLLREIQLDPAEQARKATQEMLARAVLDYRANPRMLLDDDKFDAINARRGELALGSDAAELLRKSEAAVRRRRRRLRGGMALVAALVVTAAVLAALIIGAQQKLRRTQDDIATNVSELAKVSTEAAHGRATQTAVVATSEVVSAAGTAVAAQATAAAFRIQAELAFQFHDYVASPGIPGQPIFGTGAQLEIAIAQDQALPLRLDHWTKKQALSNPITVLTSHVQIIDSQTYRTVDGTAVKQVNTFRDFVGDLGRYADPALWNGITVEAVFQATSRHQWLRAATGQVRTSEFDAFYGIDPASRDAVEEYSDYRVRPAWPCTLEIYVSGVRVATLDGYLAAVWEHDEDARGLYVARFGGQAGK